MGKSKITDNKILDHLEFIVSLFICLTNIRSAIGIINNQMTGEFNSHIAVFLAIVFWCLIVLAISARNELLKRMLKTATEESFSYYRNLAVWQLSILNPRLIIFRLVALTGFFLCTVYIYFDGSITSQAMFLISLILLYLGYSSQKSLKELLR